MPRLRLAELVSALSLATDLGTGQPMEHALRTCLFSLRAAKRLGLTPEELADTYYLALLRFVGCTADAHNAAAAFGGDELATYPELALVLMGEPPEMLRTMLRHVAREAPLARRARLVGGVMLEGKHGADRSLAEHCQAAQMLARRMGFGDGLVRGLGAAFERWDGHGSPGLLDGEAIPPPVRVVIVARDVELFGRIGGWPLAAQVLRRRRGRAYAPEVVDAFLDMGTGALQEIQQTSAWEAVLEAEPEPVVWIREPGLDRVLVALADFADLKSPYLHGHSREVAELVEVASRKAGLASGEEAKLRRAAWLHDLGRVGVPSGIWDKPGPLSSLEWERVRLHPYYGERMLGRAAVLGPLAALAGAHHERLDGSGYHRGSQAAQIPFGARLLAAADAYQAMTQPRPHRAALSPDQASRALQEEADDGRLDGEAVEAVLRAAGLAGRRVGQAWPAGLTDREVEVLRLLCQGLPNRRVARQLYISPKTVGRHVENIYGKIGVSTRAGAALFAMEHDLLRH